MVQEQRVLIIGASLGGLRTAEALRREGYAGEIIVVGEENRYPYNRPPLSKDFLFGRADEYSIGLPLRAVVADVEWRLGVRAESADLIGKSVQMADGVTIRYSSLIIATGLRPRRLQISPGVRRGRFALRTIDDAIRLRASVAPGVRVLVVGAGFVGCEVAATCRALGCNVTVVGNGAVAMSKTLGDELGLELMSRHRLHGVEFMMERQIVRIRGAQSVECVETNRGETLYCDVVVEAIGSEFNVEWLVGNDLDIERGVLTNSAMRVVGRRGIVRDAFAVGDVARFPNARFGGRASVVEHWNIPTETGRRAAQVIAAECRGVDELARVEGAEFAPIPSFWSDQYDNHILAYGMPSLKDRVELLHGDPRADCVYGFFSGSSLVGVCGVGDMRSVMKYRDQIGLDSTVASS